MLDRVTVRTKMRDELIGITRMLLGLPPAVAGDLPAPTEAETEAASKSTDKDPKPAKTAAEPAGKDKSKS